MDLDSFLVALYTSVDDWWKQTKPDRPRRGHPVRLTDSEVLTLALLAQFPPGLSERGFWRFATGALRSYFPHLGSQSQFNRRLRAVAPRLRALQQDWAGQLADPTSAYHVLDTTLIPVMRRVRAGRHGLFAGQAGFGWSAAHTDWVYGFKLGLAVTPAGVITAFALAPAATDDRQLGEALLVTDRYPVYLADKGFTSHRWEAHCARTYGVTVLATPQVRDRRQWPAQWRLWSAGKRHVVEQVIGQLKGQFGLPGHRAKTLSGLLARLAAKVTAYTAGQWLNRQLGRPLRRFADLLV